jgi:hypothetical protein
VGRRDPQFGRLGDEGRVGTDVLECLPHAETGVFLVGHGCDDDLTCDACPLGVTAGDQRGCQFPFMSDGELAAQADPAELALTMMSALQGELLMAFPAAGAHRVSAGNPRVHRKAARSPGLRSCAPGRIPRSARVLISGASAASRSPNATDLQIETLTKLH